MLREFYLTSLTFVLLAGCTFAASADKSTDSKKLPIVTVYKSPT